MSKLRIRPGLVLSLAGTGLLGWYVVSKTDLAAVVRIGLGADRALVGLAVLLYGLDRVIAGYRWQVLYNAFGDSLGIWRATRIYLESGFVGAALPATVGGDLVRARMAAPDTDSFPAALSSVILDRLLGMLALLLAAVLGLLLFRRHEPWGVLVPSLAVGLVVLGAGTGMVAVRPLPMARLERLHGWPRRALGFLVELHARVHDYARRPRALSLSTVLAFGQQYLFVFINWIVALALGLPLELTALLWMWPIVMIAARLPISYLGFGVREAVLFELFATAGLSPEGAVSLGLLSGLLDLLFIGAGGLLLVLAALRGRV